MRGGIMVDGRGDREAHAQRTGRTMPDETEVDETDVDGANPGEAHEDEIDVIVEIPMGSRNKYEFDHERNVIRLDRRLSTSTTYPADYGFVPGTLAKDGDPLDALVLLDDPTFPGCLVRARVLGVFWMRDEMGPDAKLITVLAGDAIWDEKQELSDIPGRRLEEIEHFFSIYKDLERGKVTETEGFGGHADAMALIEDARRRYREHEPAG
jgi:inorganic pyrophosphatase